MPPCLGKLINLLLFRYLLFNDESKVGIHCFCNIKFWKDFYSLRFSISRFQEFLILKFFRQFWRSYFVPLIPTGSNLQKPWSGETWLWHSFLSVNKIKVDNQNIIILFLRHYWSCANSNTLDLDPGQSYITFNSKGHIYKHILK